MVDVAPGALETLLRQDGIELIGTGDNKKCLCWLHKEKTPSMSVNVATSQYHCFGCQSGGDAFTYLKDVHGLEFKEAQDRLADMGWTQERLEHSRSREEAEKRRKRGATARYVATPVTILTTRDGEEVGREYMRHLYHTAGGQFIGMKIRYTPTSPELAKHKAFVKLFPFTPAPSKGGGWWWTTPNSKTLPEEDRYHGKLPLYRLPEFLERLKGSTHETQVWLVEGEKKVDVILKSEGGFPGNGLLPPVTCVWGGYEKTFKHVDLSPLNGRKVLLVADTDTVGVEKFRALGNHLRKNYNCTVKTVFPEGEGGFDVADAILQGDNKFAAGLKWIRDIGVEDLPEEEPQETLNSVLDQAREGSDIPKAIEQNGYFRVLGISDGMIAIRKNNTMEILLYRENQLLQLTTFTRIADLEFWVGLCAPKAFSNHYRLVFVNEIMRVAETKGMVDLSRAVLGRGGFVLNKRPHFYLGGSRVLSADDSGMLTHEQDINNLGQVLRPGPEIHAKRNDQAAAWAREIYDAVLEYRWATSFDGHVFLGWAVTSLIGGLLPFRPMVWLVAPPESGKTFLHTPVLNGIMGNALWVSGDLTAAAIMDRMKDDSLAVWIDEFEPGVGRKDERYRDILAGIRLASSGEAEYARGGPAKSLNARPRFSAICSSVNQATMALADETRFVTIRFNRQGVADWPSVRDRIQNAVESPRGSAVRERIIVHAGKIVELALRKAEVLGSDANVSTRSAQIYGALSAGACFLAGEMDVKAIPLNPRRHYMVEDDEWRPLEILLTTPLPFRQGQPLSMAEAVAELRAPGMGDQRNDFTRDELEKFMARYGMRWMVNGSYQALCFAHESEALKMVLRNTEFANFSMPKYLLALPGMERNVGRVKIGPRTHRCVGLKLESLQEQGFFTE